MNILVKNIFDESQIIAAFVKLDDAKLFAETFNYVNKDDSIYARVYQ